ncbi:unnamed protein product, partial [Chrysoparadoxa australica]
VCLRSNNVTQWRLIADVLKDLMREVPVEFTESGMKLVCMDPASVALLHLQATAEFFYCKSPITVGIDLDALYKVLRNVTGSGYMLELSLMERDTEYLQVVLYNSDKRTKARTKLRLIRLPEVTINIPKTTFERVLSIPSGDFQRYIRELVAISDRISVTSTKDTLVLAAEGGMGSTEIEVSPTASGLHWHVISKEGETCASHEPITGIFLSKYLERFSRPLDSVVDIFIRDKYPLVLRYVMQSATIRLAIAPICEDEDN